MGSTRSEWLSDVFRGGLATAIAAQPLWVAGIVLDDWTPALLGFASGIFVAMVAVWAHRRDERRS